MSGKCQECQENSYCQISGHLGDVGIVKLIKKNGIKFFLGSGKKWCLETGIECKSLLNKNGGWS